MASRSSQAFALAMFLAVLMASTVESQITCAEVGRKLISCVSYAKGGGEIPPTCCSGVARLKEEATTTGDRRVACQCIKDFAKRIEGLNEDLVAGIPDKCGVQIGYPVRLSTDCSKVK